MTYHAFTNFVTGVMSVEENVVTATLSVYRNQSFW